MIHWPKKLKLKYCWLLVLAFNLQSISPPLSPSPFFKFLYNTSFKLLKDWRENNPQVEDVPQVLILPPRNLLREQVLTLAPCFSPSKFAFKGPENGVSKEHNHCCVFGGLTSVYFPLWHGRVLGCTTTLCTCLCLSSYTYNVQGTLNY